MSKHAELYSYYSGAPYKNSVISLWMFLASFLVSASDLVKGKNPFLFFNQEFCL